MEETEDGKNRKNVKKGCSRNLENWKKLRSIRISQKE
jgi:hypothetical protein